MAEATPTSEPERALIEQLIAATKLYNTGAAIKDLFDFTIRLREIAPFNAMLLHIQKPGLTYAATASHWRNQFGRKPKIGARPLLILQPWGPVNFVFDVQDTEGRELPEGVFKFPTFGDMTEQHFAEIMKTVKRNRIRPIAIDAGDGYAGWIRLVKHSRKPHGSHQYALAYNRNHDVPTRFVTAAHELAHLHLGHLGPDRGRGIRDRHKLDHAVKETEAETTAYLVAKRNGVTPRSESYLANYQGAFEDLDIFGITRAASAVERVMGIFAVDRRNDANQLSLLDPEPIARLITV